MLLAGLWAESFFFSYPFARAPIRGPVFFRSCVIFPIVEATFARRCGVLEADCHGNGRTIPCELLRQATATLRLKSFHHKPRVGGTRGRVRRGGSDGWRSRVSRGDNTGGARSCTSAANHRSPVPLTGSVHRDGSCCGQCTRWRILHFLTGATLRHQSLRAVAAAVFFRQCGGDFGFVSRHKPAEHCILDVPATPPVAAGVSLSALLRCVRFFAGEIVEEALPRGFSFLETLFQGGSTTFVLQGQLPLVLHDTLCWPRASSFGIPWERGVGSVSSC